LGQRRRHRPPFALALALGLALAPALRCAHGDGKGARTPADAQGGVPVPPIAPRKPATVVQHGETRVDDYAWLRDKDSPQVLAHLRAEAAYTRAVMKPTESLQQRLYNEIVGRIEETDQTPPVRRGDHLYYSRTERGKQYETHCRRRGSMQAPEEVLLDLNRLAEGEKFLDLGVFEVSDDGARLLYSLDTTGFRDYTLFVKDLRSGELGKERIEHVGSAAWAADGRTIFYTVEDDAKRPYRLYRRTLGSGADDLVYEEKDERFVLQVWRARSKAFVFAGSFSHTASEVRFLPAAQPEQAPRVIAERRADHEYSVEHGGDLFYILTNDSGRNFRLVTTRVTTPGPEHWQELVPHSDAVMLEDNAVFAEHLVLHEREQGVPYLRVRELGAGGKSARVALPEPIYEVHPGENPEFQSAKYRFVYESLTTPKSHYDYDFGSGALQLLKRTPVLGGYDPARFRSERVHARAPDGTAVPISLVRSTAQPAGPAPMLLTGYGAYGYPLPTSFSYARISLLERGVTVAIAHVRGGGELGKRWHDQGRMDRKPNTFSDFIAAAEHLIASGATAPDRLVIEGASAGGLLVAAVLNRRPELFRAALLDMPFVDVLNTMSDASLPLTVGEYEEWGNPQLVDQYRNIKAYCPYTNVRAQRYPSILVKTSYNDSQVMYWEPAKYVAKLRALKTDANPLLLWINMHAGHSGASGRYDALRERAFDFAFVLAQLGMAKGE
jgi:oligopeptidase B